MKLFNSKIFKYNVCINMLQYNASIIGMIVKKICFLLLSLDNS